MILALVLLAAAPSEPPVVSPGVDDDDRAVAATASGASTFVGIVVGSLGVPAVTGLIVFAATGAPAKSDDLLVMSVVGGTAGAALGGLAGAWTTTTTLGTPAVAGAAAAGALVGLVPAALFGREALTNTDKAAIDNAKLAQSITTTAALALASGAAAATGAVFASPGE